MPRDHSPLLLASTLALAGCGAGASPPPSPVGATAAPLASQAFVASAAEPVFLDPARRAKLEAAFPQIDAIAQAELAFQKAPGMAVGVVIDGELAYVKGFGQTDLPHGKAPDGDTVFRIGSITKSFTALAVLSLRDQGLLRLDDPLVTWLPEAAGLAYPTRDTPPITLRQLLTHTSGLQKVGTWDIHHNPSERDVLATLKGFPFEAVPGSRYIYSNMGFSLLGFAASRAAHTSVRELLASRVLRPLGMTSTYWEAADVPQGRLATSYDRGPTGDAQPLEPVRLGAAEASGGLYSSVRDMARYIAFQLAAYPPRDAPESGPVRRGTVREAHTTGFRSGLSVQLEDAPEKGAPLVRIDAQTYGFGWLDAQTCDFDDLISHGGWIDGFQSDVRFLPSRGVGVITFMTHVRSNPGAVSQKALLALLRTGGLAKRSHTPSPALDAAVKQLLAVYNTWSESAYLAMLTADRPKHPEEKDELAGYKALHGACTSFAPIELDTPLRGRFRWECERGTFEMRVDVAEGDGKIAGFTGTSFDIDLPKNVRAAAEDLVGLIGKWDDGVHDRRFSGRTENQRKDMMRFLERVRAAHGACTIAKVGHEAFDHRFALDCERGGALTLTMSMAAGQETAIQTYVLRPESRGICPVR